MNNKRMEKYLVVFNEELSVKWSGEQKCLYALYQGLPFDCAVVWHDGTDVALKILCVGTYVGITEGRVVRAK